MPKTKLIQREAMEIRIPRLPEDIGMDILSRLSAKNLIQLKCVCKPWLSLISDPHFAKLQLAQSKKNSDPTLLLFTDPPQTKVCDDDRDLDHVGHLEYPQVMKNTPGFDSFIMVGGSCNGLICVVIGMYSRIFLWNPTLGEAMELATSGDSHPKDAIYGLGYDISTDDYKLVRGRRHPSKKCRDFEIFASKTNISEFEILASKSNIWRKVEKEETEPHYCFFQNLGIYLRGGLHWLVEKPTKIFLILVFDMVEEKFSELVELPDCIVHDKLILTKSVNNLFLFCGDLYRKNDLEAWKLNEYGVKSSWTKIFCNIKCTLPERTLPQRKFGNLKLSLPQSNWCAKNLLHYTRLGKIIVDCRTDLLKRKCLFSYDPEQNTWKEVRLFCYPVIGTYHFNFDPTFGHYIFVHAKYVESLISPYWYRPTSTQTVDKETSEGVQVSSLYS